MVLEKMIRSRNLRIGAEIGVAYGGNAKSILKIPGVEKLYGVDPYRHREKTEEILNFSQEDFDDICEFTLQKLSIFGKRFELIREPSTTASSSVPDDLDFVYIDGDHSYRGVLSDLCTWFKEVRNGGVIAGHDYDHPGLGGIKKAVDEFFRRFDWKINVESDFVWWVEKKPLNISFFIPTYNYGKSIRDSVSSIMDSNFSSGDELIIVDDGSTDNTARDLLELKSEYPEIKIITHSRNKGASAAKNSAVENCSYPIIFALDCDNILIPGSIPKLKDFFINSGADVAAFGEMHFFTGNTDNITHKWIFKNGPYMLQDCLSDNHVPGSSGNYMFTKESWIRAGGYPECLPETWGFGIRQVATGSKMLTLPNTFYLHQYNHGHGYESTYVKGERTGKISSLAALQILIPFLFLLDKKSVNYIMGERDRNRWFKRIKEKPIRVRFGTVEEYETHKKLASQNPNVPSFVSHMWAKTREIAKKNQLIKKTAIKMRGVYRGLMNQ